MSRSIVTLWGPTSRRDTSLCRVHICKAIHCVGTHFLKMASSARARRAASILIQHLYQWKLEFRHFFLWTLFFQQPRTSMPLECWHGIARDDVVHECFHFYKRERRLHIMALCVSYILIISLRSNISDMRKKTCIQIMNTQQSQQHFSIIVQHTVHPILMTILCHSSRYTDQNQSLGSPHSSVQKSFLQSIDLRSICMRTINVNTKLVTVGTQFHCALLVWELQLEWNDEDIMISKHKSVVREVDIRFSMIRGFFLCDSWNLRTHVEQRNLKDVLLVQISPRTKYKSFIQMRDSLTDLVLIWETSIVRWFTISNRHEEISVMYLSDTDNVPCLCWFLHCLKRDVSIFLQIEIDAVVIDSLVHLNSEGTEGPQRFVNCLGFPCNATDDFLSHARNWQQDSKTQDIIFIFSSSFDLPAFRCIDVILLTHLLFDDDDHS